MRRPTTLACSSSEMSALAAAAAAAREAAPGMGSTRARLRERKANGSTVTRLARRLTESLELPVSQDSQERISLVDLLNGLVVVSQR